MQNMSSLSVVVFCSGGNGNFTHTPQGYVHYH